MYEVLVKILEELRRQTILLEEIDENTKPAEGA